MHLKKPGFTYNLCRPLTKINKAIEKLRKPVIADIYTDTIYIKFVFSIISQQEQLHIKCYMIKHLKRHSQR